MEKLISTIVVNYPCTKHLHDLKEMLDYINDGFS